jgi:hypothetical protein
MTNSSRGRLLTKHHLDYMFDFNLLDQQGLPRRDGAEGRHRDQPSQSYSLQQACADEKVVC